jgi:hypothetical protein
VKNDLLVTVVKHKVFFLNVFLRWTGVLSLALTLFLFGCEGEKDDPNGTEAYFKNNPYEPAERDDELLPLLKISPEVATVSVVGREIVFTAAGGDGIYHWYVSNEANGEISSHGANQCSYKCLQVGNNDVIVQDGSGHYVAARVTPVADTMTITPSSVTLSSGARYVAFTVTGGTPPYSWTVGNASLGIISYSSSSSYTAGYTAVAGAYGQNTVSVKDSEGRVASATVTQSQ